MISSLYNKAGFSFHKKKKYVVLCFEFFLFWIQIIIVKLICYFEIKLNCRSGPRGLWSYFSKGNEEAWKLSSFLIQQLDKGTIAAADFAL